MESDYKEHYESVIINGNQNIQIEDEEISYIDLETEEFDPSIFDNLENAQISYDDLVKFNDFLLDNNDLEINLELEHKILQYCFTFIMENADEYTRLCILIANNLLNHDKSLIETITEQDFYSIFCILQNNNQRIVSLSLSLIKRIVEAKSLLLDQENLMKIIILYKASDDELIAQHCRDILINQIDKWEALNDPLHDLLLYCFQNLSCDNLSSTSNSIILIKKITSKFGYVLTIDDYKRLVGLFNIQNIDFTYDIIEILTILSKSEQNCELYYNNYLIQNMMNLNMRIYPNINQSLFNLFSQISISSMNCCIQLLDVIAIEESSLVSFPIKLLYHKILLSCLKNGVLMGNDPHIDLFVNNIENLWECMDHTLLFESLLALDSLQNLPSFKSLPEVLEEISYDINDEEIEHVIDHLMDKYFAE